MLVDHGWTVEFEPAIGAQTPDLLIRKGSVENIVEIRRVVGRAAEDSRSRLMVQRVLEDIRTATPLNIEQLQVDGGASLKPLVAHVKAVLADRSKPTGPQIFTSPGVFVAYEVSAPGDSDEPTLPAVFGWPIRIIHGGDEDRVKTAISEKLRVYKQPIVVALDLAGVMNGFDDVIDAFYGERKIHVPIDSGDGAPNRPAYLGPMQDGMLVGRHRNAARARERLLALLPFVWGMSPSNYADGFDVLARVLANPAIEPPSMLDEFAPIPRFVVASREGAGHAMMQWVPPVDPKGWRHVP